MKIEGRMLEMSALSDRPSGTQAIERSVALLRAITTNHHEGCRLSQLAAICALQKSTTHRILTCLIRERMVVQRSSDRRYVPGPLLFELGLSAYPGRSELQHLARLQLADLSKQTSCVAYLFFRSGDDYVCSVRVGGSRLVTKGLTIFPGSRRPLAYSAGGAAILKALPHEEASEILHRNLGEIGTYSDASHAGIVRMLSRTSQDGFAINAGDIIDNVNEYALALCDAKGDPFGAICMAGSSDALEIGKAEEYRCLLEGVAKHLWVHTARSRRDGRSKSAQAILQQPLPAMEPVFYPDSVSSAA